MNKSIVHPTVHLDGTAKQDLLDVRQAFSNAPRQAITALENMAPNSRDYADALGPHATAFAEAVNQQRRRCTILLNLWEEIEDEQAAILDS